MHILSIMNVAMPPAMHESIENCRIVQSVQPLGIKDFRTVTANMYCVMGVCCSQVREG